MKRLEETRRDWKRLEETGRDWKRLEETGREWMGREEKRQEGTESYVKDGRDYGRSSKRISNDPRFYIYGLKTVSCLARLCCS